MAVSCALDPMDKKQTEFHGSVSEIEEIVLTDYSDVLRFSEPDINEDALTVEWDVYFLRRYVRNNDLKDSMPPYKVMEDVRETINMYMIDNPEYKLKDYKVDIVFWEPEPEWFGQETTRSIGHIYNYSFLPEGNEYDSFSVVEFYQYDDWNCLEGQEDIYEIYLGTTSLDDTLEIIDTLPNLQVAYVSNEIRDEISDLRPNIDFY